MAALTHMVIKSDQGDYLICTPHNGLAETGPEVAVAKPYLSRRKVFETDGRDGFAYTYPDNATRTSTKSGVGSEVQVMTPNIVAGDHVWIADNIEGGTAAKDNSGKDITRQIVTWGRGFMEQ